MQKNIFLKPGDWFFGKGQGKVTTILGSCVSVVLWHSKQHLVGVSHILLPGRTVIKNGNSIHSRDLSGRFADEMLQIFQMEMALFGVKAQQFEAHLIGGGDMFPTCTKALSIGQRNIEMTTALLAALKIAVVHTDTGGGVYRRLTVDINTGQLKVERSEVNRFELLSA